MKRYLLTRKTISGFSLGALLCLVASSGVTAAGSEPAWRAEWERTTKAAEKEAKVVIYSTRSVAPVLRGAFQKRYPGIKVSIVTARGFQLGQRIMTERRGAKYIPDVFIQGATTPTTVAYPGKALDPIKPLFVLPDVVDESRWWRGKHHYVDPKGKYIFMFEGGASSGGIIYNTNQVSPDQLKSYWDLLKPEWRGKIVAIDPTRAGPASQTVLFLYHSPKLGPEYLQRLFTDSDVTVIRDDDQLIDWVGVGKFALGLFPRSTRVANAVKAGLPLRTFLPGHFQEGGFVSPSGFTISYFNRAPHPNAAKVLINWFLSREGQMAYLDQVVKDHLSMDSLREDIPKGKLSPNGRRVQGVNYFLTNTYELISQGRGEVRRFLNKILAKDNKK